MRTTFTSSIWKLPFAILLTFAVLITVHDIWYVADGRHDGWWPFFLPVILLLGALAWRHYGRIIDAAPPEAITRLDHEVWEDSFLNPKNFSPEKKNPPDIG